MLLINRNLTFQLLRELDAGLGSNSVALVDVSGDGKLDILTGKLG